ncbi:MAG: SGNH/GDSL hydrolase family protein [Armatimonadetes bacterium]|nr:SGNH/GDSL hydrolase family protein [Armatimonadota bacterium]
MSFALVALGILALENPGKASSFYLQDGDRVLFYGDSITAAEKYTEFVELFARTRYPDRRFTFYNVGMPGDASWGGPNGDLFSRMNRDVKPFHATVATVMMGMNDGGYVSFSPRLQENFSTYYPKLIDGIRNAAPGAKMTLIRTSPYDGITKKYTGERPTFAKDYNDALQKYGEIVSETARKDKLDYADFNVPVLNVLEEGKRRDMLLARALIPDSVHPCDAGHLVMAAELLKSWRADSVVSEVVIDAAANKVVSEVGAEVSGVSGLAWRQRDNALPFPVALDQTTKFVLGYYPFQTSLNNQLLRVLNLEVGDYELTIDGKVVGQFSSDFLQIGVNLAEYNTPMLAQSRAIHRVIQRKNKIQRSRWFGMRSQGSLDTLVDVIEDATREDRAKLEVLSLIRSYRYYLRKIQPLAKPVDESPVPVKKVGK